ncbi:MAG: DUF805 domain-containing protein [Alphaproteobacteria bacterium]
MNSIDWRNLFISAEGRLTRTHFWVAAGLLIGVLMLYEAITGTTSRLLTGWMVYPILIFMGSCVLSKRFHDRGRSGWFAAPVIVALIGVMGPWRAIDLVFLAIVAWAVVELAVLTGEQGANRFGVSPVRKPA